MLRSWMLRDAPFVKHRACVSYLSNSVPGPSLPANYLCWQGWSSELYWTLFVYALSSPWGPWNSVEIWDSHGDHVSPGVPAIPGRFFLWWRLWPYQMRHTEKGKDSQQLVFSWFVSTMLPWMGHVVNWWYMRAFNEETFAVAGSSQEPATILYDWCIVPWPTVDGRRQS